MIEVNNLVKRFDGFSALDDCNLSVPKGAVYGLVGPNGAGKSTLLRSVSGVYMPDGGTITLGGEAVWENPGIKEKITFISDNIYYFMQATTHDMMKFFRGVYKPFDMGRYKKLGEVFTGIDERTPIRRLSKGMQKQVAFWLAICRRPEYLLLDEPVDGLDPVMRRQVWSLLMSDVSEYGTTVLVSSHNLRELEDVCDHVGIMNKGQVLIERSLSELQGSTTKIQVVFGETEKLPDGIELLHRTQVGRIHTFIVRGSAEEIINRFSTLAPLFVEALPLTLEEIFIYELGGEQYSVKNIIL